ncbi:hypothetical protein P9A53_gp02 [Xanthomonas phage vB_Xar_IVIA-DoCa6]|uniref:Uncharacterized protein n=1 Tax=Xanthomonas phage vB_Xar_IVIA-DoCa6 TaxID=2975533 RepID=A0A9X9JMV6_9CAUD|nr:hypothetical protein P9A53_gp02 [Xanthomonas phage vB_Xar_IVIA-DoCa6]UYA98746.1 hypothetical protein IVIADoCa6_2 [Xanthomonas phage vB_Xar_IVIA-DoCa6]
MKVFDPSALVPYQILTIPEPEASTLVDERNEARRSRGGMTMLAHQQEKFLASVARERADRAWLEANTPMGTVFDLLGVSHMVISAPHYIREPAPNWGPLMVGVMAPDGRGGIDRSVLSCAQLRAMLEPGFTRP